MSRPSYAEQMLDPRWQRKRLEAMQAAGWKCERCSDDKTTLHVHHHEYRRGALAWEYELHELQCLCSHCHGAEHGKKPPIGSRSRARDLWEFIGGFHLMACSEAASDDREWSDQEVADAARRYCAEAGYDIDQLNQQLEAAMAAIKG